MTMNSRERVYAAIEFRRPDIVPVEHHPSAAGLYDHGEKLRDLWRTYPQDFGDHTSLPIPQPDPAHVMPDGSYHATWRDEWGVLWEYRIFGIMGHPLEQPLADISNLDSYQPPIPGPISGPDFYAQKAACDQHKQKYFLKGGWIKTLEVLDAVRRFEDVLMDIAFDTKEINRLADIICDYMEAEIRRCIALGLDAIQFGDDHGTQNGLLMSRETWLRFFKPRYARLIAPIKKAGVKVLFHSCGNIAPLLPDLADLGVDAIWPQINLYDFDELACQCCDLHLAVAIHPERSHTMTYGTPDDVRQHVRRLADVFKPWEGGSWFYIEIDNGFPWPNVQALFEAINEYR